MQISKKTLFLLVLIFSSYSLSAWGGIEKLNDGSCKFDLETGYISSSVYIKDNESFLIIDGGDSRYGTISTVYNALTCEEVTSGEKTESNFSGLMDRKGFTEVDLNYKYGMDKSFQNKITFLKNDDELTVHIEPIQNTVTQELKNLLLSISDKSASSQINISDSAKEFFGYEKFYNVFVKKLNSVSSTKMNINYALSLSNIFVMKNLNVEDSQRIIFARKKAEKDRLKEIERQKLAKQEAEKRKILAKQEAEKRKLLAQQERAKKLQKIKVLKRSIGRRVSWYDSHKVDTDDCVQLYFLRKCMWVTYKYKFQGVLKAVDESSYTIQVTGVQLSTPGMVSMKYMQFKQQGISWGEGQQGSSKRVSIDTNINIL